MNQSIRLLLIHGKKLITLLAFHSLTFPKYMSQQNVSVPIVVVTYDRV